MSFTVSVELDHHVDPNNERSSSDDVTSSLTSIQHEQQQHDPLLVSQHSSLPLPKLSTLPKQHQQQQDESEHIDDPQQRHHDNHNNHTRQYRTELPPPKNTLTATMTIPDDDKLPNHKDDDTVVDAFKMMHNRYKRRPNDPFYVDDVKDMIDFHNIDTTNHHSIHSVTIMTIQKQQEHDTTTTTSSTTSNRHEFQHDHYCGPIYGLREFPGFYYFPDALHPDLQELVAYHALTKYCEYPHRTNIPNDDDDPTTTSSSTTTTQQQPTKPSMTTMWEIWKNELHINKTNRSKKNNNNNNHHHNNKKQRTTTTTKKRNSSRRCFDKLSWATMGYHYDWTERSYHRHIKSDMPYELIQLSRYFAYQSFLLSSSSSSSSTMSPGTTNSSTDRNDDAFSFVPSACIVNYYHDKSVMGGHRDDLENIYDKPIVSISIGGRSGVFLLGGNTKQSYPIVPIIIRSGDVVILGGPSRLHYHSMPRILPLSVSSSVTITSPWNSKNHNNDCNIHDDSTSTTTRTSSNTNHNYQLRIQDVYEHEYVKTLYQQAHRDDDNDDDDDDDNKKHISFEDKEALHAFMMQHRININVRQVYHDD